jgi:Transglutaminase-like superfamily
MQTWRGFWRLSGYARGIALEAAATLAATWVGLRLAGFRRWKAVLVRLAPGAVAPAAAMTPALVDSAREIARLEHAAARHLFFRASCLEESLTLWWLLRRRGIAAELRIGARKEAGRFEAHAWLEFDGEVLNDAGEKHPHFVPFDGPITSMESQTP